MDQEAVKKWFSHRENQFLFLLIVFTVALRLYYFFKLGAQPIWWDEGDYLSIAKVWALNQPLPDWWVHFTGMRPLLMPIIWAAMFKLGLSELVLRFFTLLIPSIIAIYVVYLIGNAMYNWKVGIFAAFMLSVYWCFMFYTYRLLTDIPGTMFCLLAIYFFYKTYLQEKKQMGFYLFALFSVLAFSTRFPLVLIPATCLLYLFILRRFSLFKDKGFWKGMLAFLIFISPFLIYVASTKFYFIQFYFVKGVGGVIATKQAFGYSTLGLSMSLLHGAFLIAFIIGVLTLFRLVLGLDIFFKQKNESLNADFFIVLLIVVQYLFYIFVFRGSNDRWILMITIPMFILAAKGIDYLYHVVKEYNKEIALGLAMIILIMGAYQNLSHANQLIDMKKDSYGEIKLAGEWLKQNTPTDAKIITASKVQNQYYSERESYSIGGNVTGLESCWDYAGNPTNSEFCLTETEKRFNEYVAKLKPDYFIISVFEPVFTPQWAYTYGQRNNLTFIQMYQDKNGQPMLGLYKFNKN